MGLFGPLGLWSNRWGWTYYHRSIDTYVYREGLIMTSINKPFEKNLSTYGEQQYGQNATKPQEINKAEVEKDHANNMPENGSSNAQPKPTDR